MTPKEDPLNSHTHTKGTIALNPQLKLLAFMWRMYLSTLCSKIWDSWHLQHMWPTIYANVLSISQVQWCDVSCLLSLRNVTSIILFLLCFLFLTSPHLFAYTEAITFYNDISFSAKFTGKTKIDLLCFSFLCSYIQTFLKFITIQFPIN